MTRERVVRDDAGFTLVELLVVLVIEALIVGGLGSAFILVMNNSTSVKDSLDRTEDARIAASYIISDARNSSGPETSLADTASCPDPSPPVSGTPTAVVRFNWDSTSSAGATTPNVVNYVLVSNALLRRQCRNGSLVSDAAIATKIASVAVACAPTAGCSGTPTTVTATVTETQDSAGGAALQYSLTGAYRKALAVGAPAPAITTTSPLPAGTQSSAYSTTLAGSGGTAPYTWSATGIPTGLTLNASTGVLSGTPPTAATSIIAVTLTDAVGATATKNLSLTVNATGPTITSVTLANGGATQGRLEKGDTITVVFSAPMSVSSLCTAWSGDASDQVLFGSNDVTITAVDGTGAANDSISVTSGSCAQSAFHFGSIDLGSNAYVSGGNATFVGSGNNKSKIAWTAATHTLTITLGGLSTGTPATVASSKPVYAALPVMTDSAGASIINSPFTLAAAKQF